MKKIALFLLMATGFVSAQVTRNLGDFDQLKVFDRIEVTLVPSTENRIELRGARSSDVEFVTKNNLLKIRMHATSTLGGEDVKATLYYKSINDVDASEGATITSDAVIKSPYMTVVAKEGAQIELNLESKKVKVKSVTGAHVTLAGTAEELGATIGTGGILDAKSLNVIDADLSVNAGGEIDVTASDDVNADVKAGGNIRIFGSPRHVNKKTSLGGTIEVRE